MVDLPSGYLTVCHGKIHPCLRTVNHLFLWAICTVPWLSYFAGGEQKTWHHTGGPEKPPADY